jgi:hypothetical protein
MSDIDRYEVADSICLKDEQGLRAALVVSFEGAPTKILWVANGENGPTIRFTSPLPRG